MQNDKFGFTHTLKTQVYRYSLQWYILYFTPFFCFSLLSAFSFNIYSLAQQYQCCTAVWVMQTGSHATILVLLSWQASSGVQEASHRWCSSPATLCVGYCGLSGRCNVNILESCRTRKNHSGLVQNGVGKHKKNTKAKRHFCFWREQGFKQKKFPSALNILYIDLTAIGVNRLDIKIYRDQKHPSKSCILLNIYVETYTSLFLNNWNIFVLCQPNCADKIRHQQKTKHAGRWWARR